eukprot:COSAG01_NODE_320_length_18904_cov_45.662537_21_plen_145_part_00
MFKMCVRVVFTMEHCFLFPNHISICSFLPSSRNCMSTGTCLKLRVREPRGPVTVTTRDATSTFTVGAQDGRTRNSLSTGCKLGQDKAPMAAQDQRRSRAQCGRAGARLQGHAGGGSPPAWMLSSRSTEVTFLMIFILHCRYGAC